MNEDDPLDFGAEGVRAVDRSGHCCAGARSSGDGRYRWRRAALRLFLRAGTWYERRRSRRPCTSMRRHTRPARGQQGAGIYNIAEDCDVVSSAKANANWASIRRSGWPERPLSCQNRLLTNFESFSP